MVEDNTWWLWLAFGVVIAIMEVAFPVYVFGSLALGSIATGLLLWSGLAPDWMAADTVNALIVFAGLSVAIWLVLRLTLGRRRDRAQGPGRDGREG